MLVRVAAIVAIVGIASSNAPPSLQKSLPPQPRARFYPNGGGQQRGLIVDCPTRKCRCEPRPFSPLVDLHCPNQLTAAPTITDNDLSFEWVYLAGTRIQRLHRKSFVNLRARRLNLSGSHLAGKGAVTGDSFRWVRDDLVELVLSGSHLPDLPCRALDLPVLTDLDLSSNDLRELRRDCLRALPALTKLNLQQNALTVIRPGALRGLSHLEELDLSHNSLKLIGRGQLRGAGVLVKLDLSHNAISTVKPSAFRVFKHLKELILEHNKLQALETGLLRGLRHLRTLLLTGNPLVAIAPGTFLPARRLRHLALDFGLVKEADNATFQGLRSLNSLDLHEVGRPLLPPGLLASSPRLRRLVFTHYTAPFSGLTPESLSEQLKLSGLQVNVAPLYDCTCHVSWIQRLTQQGAQVNGRCYTVAQLTCTKYSSN